MQDHLAHAHYYNVYMYTAMMLKGYELICPLEGVSNINV